MNVTAKLVRDIAITIAFILNTSELNNPHGFTNIQINVQLVNLGLYT
jgi:hypothetical protein